MEGVPCTRESNKERIGDWLADGLHQIFAEMDIRALGDTVIGSGTDEWREALACWSAKCAGAGCGKTIYDRDTILPEIKACIDRLPDTV